MGRRWGRFEGGEYPASHIWGKGAGVIMPPRSLAIVAVRARRNPCSMEHLSELVGIRGRWIWTVAVRTRGAAGDSRRWERKKRGKKWKMGRRWGRFEGGEYPASHIWGKGAGVIMPPRSLAIVAVRARRAPRRQSTRERDRGIVRGVVRKRERNRERDGVREREGGPFVVLGVWFSHTWVVWFGGIWG